MSPVPREDEPGRGGCGSTVSGCLLMLIILLLIGIAVASVVVNK